MTINTGFLGGGGGSFTPSVTSGIVILSSGASGDIVTLTPPSGEAVKLLNLSTDSASKETVISVRISGVDAVTSKTLVGADSGLANEFFIGSGLNSNTSADEQAAQVPPIQGGIDEVITIVKDTGSTGTTIHYGYQFGV